MREDALTIAERECFEVLGEAMGYPPNKRLIGVNDGLADCMVFDIGQAYTGDLNTFGTGVVHMRATADFYHRSRAELQRVFMRLRAAFPMDQNTPNEELASADVPVLVFRVAPENGNPGGVTTTAVQLKTDAKSVNVWTFSAVFDVVFVAD